MPDVVRYSADGFTTDFGMGAAWQHSVLETAPLHTHDFFEIFLVTAGQAVHLVNHSIQNVRAGDMVLIRPDDVHCYDFYQGHPFEFLNFSFTRETFNSIARLTEPDNSVYELSERPLPPVCTLSAGEMDFVVGNVNGMKELRKKYTADYARNCYKSFLAYLVCRFFLRRAQGKDRAPLWLQSLISQMESIENFSEGFSRMVRLSGYTEEHLCRMMRKFYGTTPVGFINDLRLSYSLYLLANTRWEIIEISERCGFQTLSHFYHLFKRKYAMTPKKYRNLSQ